MEQTIKGNLDKIRERMAKAALRVGRDPYTIQLVAVSKRKELPLIEQAISAGQTVFGENYMQEAKDKIAHVGQKAKWHFIGHIQSNKAKDAAAHFDLIQTLDRPKLARALNKHAAEQGRVLPVLIQVNIGMEPQKAGVLPEEAESLVKTVIDLPNLRLKGLMTMPPFMDDPEDVRPFFRALRKLAEKYTDKGYFSRQDPPELSMGMSGDFEIAIEEGATLVRIGTALFGARPPLTKD